MSRRGKGAAAEVSDVLKRASDGGKSRERTDAVEHALWGRHYTYDLTYFSCNSGIITPVVCFVFGFKKHQSKPNNINNNINNNLY